MPFPRLVKTLAGSQNPGARRTTMVSSRNRRTGSFVKASANDEPGRTRKGEMKQTNREINRLARRQHCPRCDLDKTWGSAICHSCRQKLPANMRAHLERIEEDEPSTVFRAIRAAANYFDVHFRSIREFGGGRRK